MNEPNDHFFQLLLKNIDEIKVQGRETQKSVSDLAHRVGDLSDDLEELKGDQKKRKDPSGVTHAIVQEKKSKAKLWGKLGFLATALTGLVGFAGKWIGDFFSR